MSSESMSRPLLRTSSSSLDNPMTEHAGGTRSTNGSANAYHHDRSYRDSGLASQLYAPASEWYETMQWSRGAQGASARRRLQLIISYAPDWIITILLAGFLALINNVYGFRREFSLTDTSLQHTHATSERVPVWLLAVLAVLVPIGIQGFISLGIARSFWDFHVSVLGLILANAITLTATTIIKVCVGRPRPDFLDRCQPRAGAANAPVYGLATEAVCTTPVDSHLIQDGFRSFPSGHSSTAFAGLVFLALYLAGKFRLFSRRRGEAHAHAAVQWIVSLPLLGATLIAVSRTMDYRHHATDVIAGAILGSTVAVGSYYLYYPSLTDAKCHRPYAARVLRARVAGSASAANAVGLGGEDEGGLLGGREDAQGDNAPVEDVSLDRRADTRGDDLEAQRHD